MNNQMLEGLDKVNWRALRHVYGSAEDIPDLLRTIVEARDEDVQNKACDDLVNSINHQGTLSNATAATVPFLIQMLSNTTFTKRTWILDTFIYLMQSCNEQ